MDNETVVGDKYSEELRVTGKTLSRKVMCVIAPLMTVSLYTASSALASTNSQNPAEDIRRGFEDIINIFTAIVEPILWFYALTACILIATKNKEAGWQRLKQVGYAYAAIALLPTFFAALRWMSDMIKNAITF